MSSIVSIKDVAEAAGVSKTTVSRVVNGQGKTGRISPTTQSRVLAVARQLGYKTNLLAQNISLGKDIIPTTPPPAPTAAGESRKLDGWIGLVLSPASQATTLSLIPGLDPILATADYRLVVITVPSDPAAAQERVKALLDAGVAGLLCCPSVYTTVSTTAATAPGRPPCPIIVLWAGAAKAILATLRGEIVESAKSEAPAPSSLSENTKQTPDGSAGTPRPTGIQEFPQGRAKPPAEPLFFQQAASPVAEPIIPKVPPEPAIVTPPPVIVPVAVPVTEPEVPVETIPEPEPVIPATEEPIPATVIPPVIEIPAITVPVPVPEPVVVPEPVTEPVPPPVSPAPQPEQEPIPVPATATPEPVIMEATTPPPEPETGPEPEVEKTAPALAGETKKDPLVADSTASSETAEIEK